MFKVITYRHKDETKSEIHLVCEAKYALNKLIKDGAFILSVVAKTSLQDAREYQTKALDRTEL